MPAPWISWRKILSCKQDCANAVHDPKRAVHVSRLSSSSNALHVDRQSSGLCCSKSGNSLRNVIHGSTRVMHRSETESPPPFVKGNSNAYPKVFSSKEAVVLSPVREQSRQNSARIVHLKKLSGSCYDCSIASCDAAPDLLHPQAIQSAVRNGQNTQEPCRNCGETFNSTEALDEHFVTHHTVTELRDGDSARKVVEIIFQTSWLRKDIPCGKPERIFKVHNNDKTESKFEEYREMVKAKASKLPKKHSRCLADGNELLRFYSTTTTCLMSKNGHSSLCSYNSCRLCHILRSGFPIKGQPGIYTTASSGKAHEIVANWEESEADSGREMRAMLVCRVIAGRAKKIYQENSEDGSGNFGGYDSVAGEAGPYSNLEELWVFNPNAVLPCFIVIYRC